MSWSYGTAKADPGHAIIVTLCLALFSAVAACVLVDEVSDFATYALIFGIIFVGVSISPPAWIVAFLLDRWILRPLIERPWRARGQ